MRRDKCERAKEQTSEGFLYICEWKELYRAYNEMNIDFTSQVNFKMQISKCMWKFSLEIDVKINKKKNSEEYT